MKKTKFKNIQNKDKVNQIDRNEHLETSRKISAQQQGKTNEIIIDIKHENYFSNVRDCYKYLRKLSLQSKLFQEIMPVVWRHQLYSLFSNRAIVDAELDSLIELDYLRIISHGESSKETDAIVLLKDFIQYYRKFQNSLINLFISKMVKKFKKTQYSFEELQNNSFGSEAIRKLTTLGLLTNNENNNKQLSFGGLGVFVKRLFDGREYLLKMIRKCKYSQLLQSELAQRIQKTKQCQDLGLEFHLYDLYGRDGLVNRTKVNNPGDCLIQLIL